MPKVAILKTSPQTIIDDYKRLIHLAEYEKCLSCERDLILKLNLSWTKYFPSCSTEPWQLDGILNCLIEDGFLPSKLFPVENKTVVTNPLKGASDNKWLPVLKKYHLKFISLPEVEWTVFKFKEKLLVIDKIFPEGISIPKMFIGKDILHLPTIKTHGHSITTGAIKNAFGGLLKEYRHYAHKYIHETLVDLLIMQKELHTGVFAVMDGCVAGDGAGPRTMIPRIKNVLLASSDSVAIDAVSAKLMGFEPMEIPYIRMANDMGLGVGKIKDIEFIGDCEAINENWNFKVKRSPVIFVDQMIRKGFLQRFERILLHSPLWHWAPIASNFYHDILWYPTIGRIRINKFMKTEWGKLFRSYE
ncbi:MAG: DUF362 domain-containing protein [bacterium]